MQKVSKKQALLNRKVAEIKKSLPPFCSICGRPGNQLAHLLPKSIYPEYYTERWNLVIMCHACHNNYDNDIAFRQRKTQLYNRIKEHDEQAAYRYFKI